MFRRSAVYYHVSDRMMRNPVYAIRLRIHFICLIYVIYYGIIHGMKRKIRKHDFASFAVIMQLAVMAAAAAYNILYSLNVEGTVSKVGVTVSSWAALFCYAAAAVVILRSGRRDITAVQLVLWAAALVGFCFYAADRLFGAALVVPAIEMTAFLRFMTVIFTLPILAYNIIIASVGDRAAAFILALMPTLILFITYTAAYIKFRRDSTVKNGAVIDK